VVTLSVNPSSASLSTSATQAFTVLVTGTTQTAVTWSVVETGGGSVDSGGLYTAPATAGTFHVKATSVADASKSAQATVTVTAPPVISVSVSPATANLQTGATQTFSATVTGTANAAVTWSVVEAGGGSVNPTGLYTAPSGTGTFHVKATSVADPSKSAQAAVTVTAAPVISVAVSPATANLQAGATQAFSATVTGTANTAVTWSVVETGGGSVDASGLYTAPSTGGTFHVKATSVADGSKSAQAAVTVTVPPPVVTVTVSPATASVLTSATQSFSATVTGTSNLAVNWSVVEAGGGSVSAAGLYTAPSSGGVFHVKATSLADPSKSAQATVTATAPQVIAVVVSPSSLSLQPNATGSFSAAVTGTSDLRVNWSVVEAGGGSVSAAGLYTAPGSPGTFQVRATSVADASKFDQATVTVAAAPGISVTVSPASANLQVNATQAFSATVTGTADTSVIWSVVEAGGGSVSAAGLYTAPGVPGTFHVRATSVADGNQFDQATVTVAAQPAVSVTVSPATASLQTSATQLFTATVAGTANTAVTWSVVEAGGGSVSAAGLYTAPGVPGKFHVRATSVADGTKYGQGAVTVTAPLPTAACNASSLGVGADLNGFRAFPATNAWNQDISGAPVDPNSASIIAFIGAGSGLHADFGAGLYQGQPIGIPYVVVDGLQARVPIVYTAYGNESDPGPMPIPATAPVEGGNASTGDRHVLVMDRDACVLYELYRAFLQPNGSWTGDSGAIWDLKSDALRPFGWTSADAAGLPIFPGLARYDEAARGEITHALRFTVPTTRQAYVLPATHWASSNTNTSAPPMGMRVRLKAGVDIGGYPAQAQVVLQALKKYGMILADNGSAWFISGAPDDRWDNDQLSTLSGIKGSDLEVVRMDTIYTADPTGPAPAISSFAASPSTVSAGAAAGLHWTATDATRFFVTPEVGWVSGTSAVVHPQATTTYTLTAEGPYGSATRTVVVTVGAPQVPSISAFTAAPASIIAGQTSTLNWTVNGATGLSIDHGVGTVTGTSATVSPTSTTIYTLTAVNSAGSATATTTVTVTPASTAVKIVYLHHSTGGNIWSGGVPETVAAYNSARGTSYQITERNYPDTGGGYPWANYPYDYYNLWVKHTGSSQDRGELNLDQIAAEYDVIVFKHCYPVSEIQADTGSPNIDSSTQSLENYKAQYAALKSRMLQFPTKKFIVWTGAVDGRGSGYDETTGQPQRALAFWDWVKTVWDQPGDNIFVWDFAQLETEGTYYNKYTAGPGDSHPNSLLSSMVAPYMAFRIVDVIEGRGDTGDITGRNAGPNPPQISSFTATPATLPVAGTSTLAWASTGSTRLAIDQLIGPVTGTSRAASVQATTTYNLTAINATGSVNRAVTVAVGSAPTVTVTVSPSTTSIQTGATQTFSPTVVGTSNAAVTWSVVEAGGGVVSAAGLYTAPATPGTYHVKATSAADTSKSGTATVVVTAPVPDITSFTATPASITSGQSTTLSWIVSGATGLSIDHGVGPVTGTSTTVSPTSTTTYTLTASNGSGTITATATVTVSSSGMHYLVAYNSGPGSSLGLQNNWIREAWEGTPAIPTNFAAPAPNRPGAQSIEVAFGTGNSWNAIGLAHRLDWSNIYWLFLNQFRTVEFDLQFAADSVGEDNLTFLLEDGGQADQPALTSLIPGWSSMTAAQKHGNWFHVTVDLAGLHPNLSLHPNFQRWLLFNNADGSVSRPHFFLADVKLGWVDDSTAPVITFGAASANATSTELTLPWTTNEPTLHTVEWGATTSYGHAIAGGSTEGDYALDHAVTLTGLTPGTTYYYRITAKDHQFLASTPQNQSTYTGSFAMPAAPTSPPVISGLSATGVSAVTATLGWTTDRPCTGSVAYHKSGGTTLTRSLTDLSSSRSFMLDLLEPSTTYTVTIVATDAFANVSAPATIQVTTSASSTADVTVAIDPATTQTISPWIYGLNFYGEVPGAPPHLTLDRMGGNRWTAYNWENNASNSGSDWGPYSNDSYLGGGSTPAEAVRSVIAADQTLGMATLMTVQMQGYVSADTSGLVNINDPNHLANRFKQVVYKKGTEFTAPPSTADANVYMDEFLWALKSKFSSDIFSASAALPTLVNLDNEPELWGDTHPEIQTGLITPDAYIQKTVALAKALKDFAPGVQLLGPAHYGFNGIVNWQNSTGFTDSYWFTDKYLQELKTASDVYGKRLLDAYDVHWYSEATGDGTRITALNGATLTANQVQAIVQSPRSLWDPAYTEDSWVARYLGQPVNLVGRLKAKIAASWPGTGIAISEYGNGGDNHIAGAIAQADNLGIFGAQGVYAATLWPLGDCPYILAGFRAFRGFDGGSASFGDVSLKATSSNVQNVAAYISLDSKVPGRVVIVAINRSTTFQTVAFQGQALAGTASVYRISAESAQAQRLASQPVAPVLVGQVPVSGTTWTLALPPLSVSTVEIR
jgi:hypothetical protein